jgi:hypothetical protein
MDVTATDDGDGRLRQLSPEFGLTVESSALAGADARGPEAAFARAVMRASTCPFPSIPVVGGVSPRWSNDRWLTTPSPA